MHRTECGFTYVAVLITVAVLGVFLGAVGNVWHTLAQREREEELLFVGLQMQRALEQYVSQSPGLQRGYPKRLEDLLEDRRSGTTKRHLRRVFVDPMTGKRDWGLVRDGAGGIIGVHSLGSGRPFRTQGFPVGLDTFSEARSYREWRFLAAAPVQDLRQPSPDAVTGVPLEPSSASTATAPSISASPSRPQKPCVAEDAARTRACFDTPSGGSLEACLASALVAYQSCQQANAAR